LDRHSDGTVGIAVVKLMDASCFATSLAGWIVSCRAKNFSFFTEILFYRKVAKPGVAAIQNSPFLPKKGPRIGGIYQPGKTV